MRIATKTLFVFILVMLVASFSHAKKSEINHDQICEPRVPKLNLEEVILLVKKNHRSDSLGDREIFIDMAELKCEKNTHYWEIGYRLQAYESGRVIVKVHMNSKVIIGKVIKDG